MTKVYTFALTFRAEDSNTRRLAEFRTASGEALLKYTFAALLKEREENLAFFDQRIEKGLVPKPEGIVGSEFMHMHYGEANRTALTCISLGVDNEVFDPMLEKGRTRGIEVRGAVDHGFCRSIYFRDPNGYVVELTADTGVH